MKVWLVWSGEYSGADVIGVYSTKELADAAAAMTGRSSFTDKPDGYVSPEEGYDVDADAVMVRAGISRWRVDIGIDDGAITWICELSLGTGEPPSVTRPSVPQGYGDAIVIVRGVTPVVTPEHAGPTLIIYCDARGKEHAAKIAGDERAQYLGLHQRND